MKRKEAEQRAKEEAAGPNRRKRGQQWWEQELANSKGGAEVLEQLQGDAQVGITQALAAAENGDVCQQLANTPLSELVCYMIPSCLCLHGSAQVCVT